VDDSPPVTVKEYGFPKEIRGGDDYISFISPIYLNVTDGGTPPAIVDLCTIYYRIWFNSTWTSWMHGSPAADVEFTLDDIGLGDDGKYYIEFYAIDGLGNVEGVKNQTFYVDNSMAIPPETGTEINSSIYNNATGEYWATSDSNITLNTNIPSIEIWYRIWVHGSWSIYQRWTLYTSPFTIPEEGLYRIECYCIDKYGRNESDPTWGGTKNYTIFIDNSPPVITESIGEPNIKISKNEFFVTPDTQIAFSAKDAGKYPVGLDTLQYRIWNSGSWSAWADYVNPIQFTTPSTYYLEVRASDLLGNTFVRNITFHVELDERSPVSEIHITLDPSGYVGGSSTFHIYADDDWGPWRIYYKIDGEEYEGEWNEEVHFQLNEIHGYTRGPHTIEYWAVDVAGNEERHHRGTYYLDADGPVTSLSFSGIAEINSAYTWVITPETLINLNATDRGCGVSTIYYRIDDGNWSRYTGPFTISDRGVHDLYFYSTDRLGNSGSYTHDTLQVGGGEPITTLYVKPQQPDGNNGWYVSNVTVVLVANDDGSGVDYTMYRIDNGSWERYKKPFVIDKDGIHIIEYYSVDKVGNMEEVKKYQIKMDFYGPEINIEKPSTFLYIFDRAIMPLPGEKSMIIGKITIMGIAEDSATSGIESMELYIDNQLKGVFNSNIEYTLDENMWGLHTIKIVVHDKAGNEAVKSIEAMIYNIRIGE